MENSHQKGTELNNVKETWEQNERNLKNENLAGGKGNDLDEMAPVTDLDRLVKQEASEYDNINKENRILGGDRATVNDEQGSDA